MSNIAYYANWELVEDTIEYEYRNKITASVSANIIVIKTPQRREVRSKTYEATIQDVGGAEIPTPTYLAGDSYIDANPENFTPQQIGTEAGKWHCDNISYTKELSVPVSRHIRVTWVKNGQWEQYDASESM